jgi:AbrB family looped-hinge helix DNA binding protein
VVFHDVGGTYPVVMGERGRLVVPADLRERRQLRAGATLIMLDTPGGIILATRDQVKRMLRTKLTGLGLVEELLVGERRRQATAEDDG